VLIDVVYSFSQTYRIPCTTAGDTTAASIVSKVMGGSFTCPDPASTAMCGGMTSFPTLSGLTVNSGLSLTPSFVDYEGTYYIAVGAGYTSLTVTPTLATPTGVTLTQKLGSATATTSSSGTAVTHTLVAGQNTIQVAVTVPACSSSVTTNCNEEASTKTYTLKVVRGGGLTTTIAESLQLTAAFTDTEDFMTAVKAEIVALLN